jgi:sterol desaturase/sphingolipid hydroxylase (fatty acid hydroxylase superfamily)
MDFLLPLWTELARAWNDLATTAYFVVPVLLVAAVIERLRPTVKRQPLAAIAFNLSYGVFYLYMSMLLAPLVARQIPFLQEQPTKGLIVIDPGPGWFGALWESALFFFIFDFFYYWWHRAQHTFPQLWAMHRFHHQERHLNVSTSFRHHLTEDIFRVFVILLPMAVLFRFTPVQIGAFWTAFTTLGYFIHMNLRLELGAFGWVLCGPQYHRIHHSIEHYNQNFAAFFPLWDRLFGSAYMPARGEFPATGLTGEGDGNNVGDAVLHPFRVWGQGLAQAFSRQKPHRS